MKSFSLEVGRASKTGNRIKSWLVNKTCSFNEAEEIFDKVGWDT
jgi:hypothetical protein